jgi:SAM-dependent methyltransferase
MSTLEEAVALIKTGKFAEARDIATRVFEQNRSSAATLRVIAYCDFYLNDFQGFFDKSLAILRQAPSAQALLEFVQLVSNGLMRGAIKFDENTARGVLGILSDVVAKPILQGDEAHTREPLGTVLAFLCYQLDQLTPAPIEPFAQAVYDNVLKQTDGARILAATNTNSTRFVSYLLAAIGRYDEAFGIVSIATHPITLDQAKPSIAAAERPKGTAGADAPENYDASAAIRRGGERAVKRTVPDGPLGRVLDLGCGTGVAGRLLHDRATHITGVDIDGQRLAYAKGKGYYAEAVESDAIAYLEQGDDRFDIIVFAMATPMIPDLARLIAGTAKRLAPGGAVCFDVLLCGPGPQLRRTDWSQFVRPVAEVRRSAEAAGLAVELEEFGQQEWGAGGFYRLRSAAP